MLFSAVSRAARVLLVGAAAALVSADSIVLTLGGENGGVGVSAIQCNQGVLTAQVNLQASINVNNIHDYQPMAETGLPTVTGTFAVNGAPVTVSVLNSFNVQSASASGSNWIFQLQDDGPHPGGQFSLGSCTAGTTPDIKISFTSSAITDAAGLPNGADGGPPVPAVNGPVTVVNALPAQFNGGANGAVAPVATTAAATTAAAVQTAANVVANAAITTVTVTVSANTMLVIVTNTAAATPTTAVTQNNAVVTQNNAVVTQNNAVVNAATTGSIVLTLAGENNGDGVTNIQCNQGVLTLQVVLQASVNVNNIHAYQPMAETGLPTVTATFSVNGAPPTVTLLNSFNVQSASASGANWIFQLQDDGPHPGGQFSLGSCTAGTTPTVTLSFSSSAITDAAGLPNGADGGPPVPAVNGPVTVVNALPAQFNGGATGGSAATGGAAPTTTAAAAPVATTAAGSTGTATGAIVYTFTMPGGISAQCNNGVVQIFNVGFQQSVSINGGAAMQPMAETGLTTIHAAFFVNGAAATSGTLTSSYNMDTPSVSGNVLSWTMLDDEPNPGAALTLTPATACTAGGNLAVSIALSADPVTNAINVNGAVTVVNNLPAANNAGTGSGSGTSAVVAGATTTAAVVAVATAAAATTAAAAGNTGTGTHTSTVNVKPNFNSANCGGPTNNNLLLYMGTTVSSKVTGVANTACSNGPMAECGLPLLQGTVFFAANNSAVNILSWTGGNQVFSGNTFQIQEEDDMPYYGGTMALNLPCSFATANFNSDIANQLSFQFTSLVATVDSQDNNGNTVTVPVTVMTVE
ncbi:hypothetical protein HDU82_008692 [Entophlyctis luteolus]|nr:hypothetical protein HDU82_008692 [Entophlyctis luteolus]